MPDSGESAHETAATDSGCAVDWSWLKGKEIAAATSNLGRMVITFGDGQTLAIEAAVWKGDPFLAFTPWRAPGDQH